MTAAALAASAAHGTAPPQMTAAPRGPAPETTRSTTHAPAISGPATHDATAVLVRAPVRIADAATVELLRPGAKVDVLAGARVIAAGATVVAVPDGAEGGRAGESVAPGGSGVGGGALIVVAVPRRTAAALSGAAVSSPLAVTLC